MCKFWGKSIMDYLTLLNNLPTIYHLYTIESTTIILLLLNKITLYFEL